jgi:hypothetical protein
MNEKGRTVSVGSGDLLGSFFIFDNTRDESMIAKLRCQLFCAAGANRNNTHDLPTKHVIDTLLRTGEPSKLACSISLIAEIVFAPFFQLSMRTF